MQKSNDTRTLNPYHVSISSRFAVLSFVTVTLTCFALGRGARSVLLLQYYEPPNTAVSISDDLPPIFVAPDKTVPHTRYTSKDYDTSVSIGSDTFLSHTGHTTTNETTGNNATALDEEEIHEPAGQHLLVDIEHVDGAFLNSEHHLAQAMIELVDMSGLTMLSYHCHKFLPAGVSCAGVLVESHVSFHTWPVQGVITLDLFTCGPNSLVDLLGDVESLFAVPDTAVASQEPNVVWAYKKRGFPITNKAGYSVPKLESSLLPGELHLQDRVSFFPTHHVQIHNILHLSQDTMERRM